MKSGHPLRALHRLVLTATTVTVFSASALVAADRTSLPFLSPIFGDAMVLQRGKPNTFWGWSEPGKEVRVTVGDHAAGTVTGNDGRWTVEVQPPPTGGPYTVTVDGPRHVELHDVLVGDVWLCGGQSNMAVGLKQARNGSEEVKAADHPNIRFFVVQQHVAYAPVDVPQGAWKICSPDTVAEGWGGFSAVAYFFARRLRQDVDVPIGLIEDCVGGSPAEAWASAEALRPLQDFNAALDEEARFKAQGAPEHGNFVSHWYDEYDPGQKDEAWFQADLDDSDWKPVTIPGGFAELGVPDTPAVCYFRRTVELPDPIPAGMARIHLGIIERMDTTYINGRQVGASAWVENPRAYPLFRPGVLKPGPNVITVRVLKTKPDGGFKSPPEALKLVLGDGTEIPLAGKWKGRLSVDARPPHPLPVAYENWPVMPAVLYNGMLAPVAPLAITGALWYQGEQNAGRAPQYRKLLPAMIADWRSDFGQGEFPFYIVSLPAFAPHQDTPGDDAWAEMRAAQDFVARSVPNSGLAVTIDVGDANSLHPIDKKEVGERLALVALAKHYGEDIPYSGPRLAAVERLPNALQLTFTHTDGGLVVKGDEPGEFSLRGEDGVWHWAQGKIVGDTVIVSTSEVLRPVAVRYAWQSNPRATLFNGAGLPAAPFESDVVGD